MGTIFKEIGIFCKRNAKVISRLNQQQLLSLSSLEADKKEWFQRKQALLNTELTQLKMTAQGGNT
jgi:hypothetical protein